VSGSGVDGLPGVAGEFHGRPTRRLESKSCWLEVLAEAGPRIVGFGLTGGPNILTESPQVGWDQGYGHYALQGGHRLWFAPETPECSVPDAEGLSITLMTGGIRLIGAIEPPTGLRKRMEIRLHSDAARVSIHHRIRNEGPYTLELAPWAITQMPLGGIAVVALPAPITDEDVFGPAQSLVLWPYAGWADRRLSIGERALTVAGTPGAPFKIGCLSATGAAGYLRDGLLFTKRFDPATGFPHADMGCNLEIYCDQGTLELESLGRLVRLGPGESIGHSESWELRRVEQGLDAAGVAALL